MRGGRRLSRRATLIGIGAIAGGALAACDAIRFESGATRIRLAISPGTQTLWRFLIQRNATLLRPKGHVVDFHNVPTEEGLREGLLSGKYDAVATLATALPGLAQAASVKLFLPIAWIHEGYPLVVADGSSIQRVADLPGRPVAHFPLTHPGMAFWRAFLHKHHGLRAEALRGVETLDPHVPLGNGQVEAAFVGGAGWAALRQAGGYRKVADLRDELRWLRGGDRPAIFAGFVAREEWLRANTRFVGDLIQAARQGLDLYRRDREAFLDVVSGEPSWAALSRDENAAMAVYLGYDEVPPERVGLTAEDVEDYRALFPLLVEAGVVGEAPADAGALFRTT